MGFVPYIHYEYIFIIPSVSVVAFHCDLVKIEETEIYENFVFMPTPSYAYTYPRKKYFWLYIARPTDDTYLRALNQSVLICQYKMPNLQTYYGAYIKINKFKCVHLINIPYLYNVEIYHINQVNACNIIHVNRLFTVITYEFTSYFSVFLLKRKIQHECGDKVKEFHLR